MIQFGAIFWLQLPNRHTSACQFDPSNFRNISYAQLFHRALAFKNDFINWNKDSCC